MTFQEALKFKQNIGETIKKNGYELEVLVVPDLWEDYQNWLSEYIPNSLDDEDSIPFSSNNKFRVIGICYEETFIRKDLSHP